MIIVLLNYLICGYQDFNYIYNGGWLLTEEEY